MAPWPRRSRLWAVQRAVTFWLQESSRCHRYQWLHFLLWSVWCVDIRQMFLWIACMAAVRLDASAATRVSRSVCDVSYVLSLYLWRKQELWEWCMFPIEKIECLFVQFLAGVVNITDDDCTVSRWLPYAWSGYSGTVAVFVTIAIDINFFRINQWSICVWLPETKKTKILFWVHCSDLTLYVFCYLQWTLKSSIGKEEKKSKSI